MQGKSLAYTTTKSGDFAELNTANLRPTEVIHPRGQVYIREDEDKVIIKKVQNLLLHLYVWQSYQKLLY